MNGRGKEEIVTAMKARIERGDLGRERREAIEVSFIVYRFRRFRKMADRLKQAVCAIAADRVRKIGVETLPPPFP